MNLLPSSSRGTTLQSHKARKLIRKKTYVPHLLASRLPRVQSKANEEFEKIISLCATGDEYSQRRMLLPGAETFSAFMYTASSDMTVKNRREIDDSTSNNPGVEDIAENVPKIGDSTLNNHDVADDESSNEEVSAEVTPESNILEFARLPTLNSHEVTGDESSDVEVVPKSSTSEFVSESSASPSDFPITIPRPRSFFNRGKDLTSLLMDYFDSPDNKSVKFLLKIPQFLPRMCTVRELPDGQIGTLQILKSNRIRLVLGECKFWLHCGVKVGFSEEVAYVNAEAKTKAGEIVNLGEIEERIIAVPECVTAFANNISREDFNDYLM